MGTPIGKGGMFMPPGSCHPGFRDADGKETVANWQCVEGCPVAALDEQSGDLSSQQKRTDAISMRGGQSSVTGFSTGSNVEYLGETGGASRFFKQVGGFSEQTGEGNED